MNPEIGSIMSFFYGLFPVTVYEKEVPENFVVPSMYFPTPLVFDGNDTNMTFMKSYSLPIKLFHTSPQLAFAEAERIVNTIRRKRMHIPMVNEEGNPINDVIRIRRIEERITDGVASIVVTWDSRYHYDRDDYIALENIQFDNGVKK